MRNFVGCTIFILIFFAVGCGIAGHYIQSSNSMSPTINPDDHFTSIEIKSETLNPIERFDIAIYKPQPIAKRSLEENTRYVCRVIGLGGEKIEVKKGKVFINDALLKEPFEKIEDDSNFPQTVTPAGEFFLMGDNRPNSADSRFWIKPTIKREDIYGKVNTIIHKEDWDNGKRW